MKERDIKAELQHRAKDLAHNRYSVEFERSPPQTHFRLNVFCEIVLCSGFEDDSLFVEAELLLPSDWVWSPNDTERKLTYVTQISEGKMEQHTHIHSYKLNDDNTNVQITLL